MKFFVSFVCLISSFFLLFLIFQLWDIERNELFFAWICGISWLAAFINLIVESGKISMDIKGAHTVILFVISIVLTLVWFLAYIFFSIQRNFPTDFK